MKISNGNDILPALPLYIAIADDDINYTKLILKTSISDITNDVNSLRSIVVITYDVSVKEINLTEVTNQPTWTNDLAGSLIAITDIGLWITNNPPILAGLTDVQLRATPVPVSASIDTTGLATSGGQTTGNNSLASIDGKLTNPLPISGIVDVASLPAGLATAANQQTDALTDAELRATPIPIIGAVLTGGLTDAELRTSPVAISSTNLDIRDLVFANDKVDVTGSMVAAVVSATDLDIRNLVFAIDKVDVTGSVVAAVVSATDLDIRNLVFATDKVDASGSVLGAGTNNIGDVDVLTLPALPAGDNNIGNVDIVTMPPVTAIDLDIRNLVFATDKVDVSGSSGVGVTGTFFQATQPISAASLPLPTGAATSALQTQPGVDIGDVTVNNTAGAAAVNIQDGGNSITVDGTFFQATQPVSATDLDIRNLVFATDKVDASGTTLGANSGVDIGDVTINNAAGAAAVNIQDGGNSITVDGTVTANAGTNLNTSALNLEATQADVRTALQIIDDWDETDRAKVNPIVGQAGVQGGSGAVSANTQRVVLATDVALPAGTNNIGDVDILSIVPGTAATNLGKAEDVAHVTGDTGVMVLGVSNELGTALVNANGDYTPIATDKMGQIYVNPENNKVLFRGRSASFRTLGRAGTAGQKILAIHNATGSSITVNVNKIVVDNFCTVVKAITVAPPIVRIWKFTAVPTNGTVLTKNKIGGTSTSDASATVRGDASADGTGSGTTLTVTLPAGTILDQKVAPRVITGAGEISSSSLEFEYLKGIQLGPLEGVCVFLDYTLATQNPVTDMWAASVEWEESTT